MDENPDSGKRGQLITLDISEVDPVGFNAKYYKNTQRDYKISRGKTRLFRRSLLLVFTGMVVSIVAIKYLPEQIEGDFSWLSPLLWLPRLAALVFVFLAIMRIREMRTIKPFLEFTPEGITHQEKKIQWQEIDQINVEYYAASDEIFNLLIKCNSNITKVDIKGVDEFSEDVAAVLNKYFQKYKSAPEI